MRFAGLQRTSTIDFPGCLACVVFTPGCNMNCFYCHNRELIETDAPILPEGEVQSFLEKRRGLLDGVVVSGGEPTLQPDLPEFLARLKTMGYQVKLDTNGQRPRMVEELLKKGLVDYWAVDIKASEEAYYAVTGVAGGGKTRETIGLLQASGAAFEARTTLYPGLTLEGLKELLAGYPVLPRWRLNEFRMPARYRQEDAAWFDLPALTGIRVRETAEDLLKYQPGLIF